MTTCLMRSMVARVVETKCGGTTTMKGATAWASEVTCPACLDGKHRPTEAEEYAASIAELAPLTKKPTT